MCIIYVENIIPSRNGTSKSDFLCYVLVSLDSWLFRVFSALARFVEPRTFCNVSYWICLVFWQGCSEKQQSEKPPIISPWLCQSQNTLQGKCAASYIYALLFNISLIFGWKNQKRCCWRIQKLKIEHKLCSRLKQTRYIDELYCFWFRIKNTCMYILLRCEDPAALLAHIFIFK
jgi:hypothetical protein